jgi:hypothetical protein
MYKDHVVKSLIIVFCIIFDVFAPFFALKLFFGSRFTFEYGFMFSKVIAYIRNGFFGYIYISETVHTAAILGLYFYAVSFLFLVTLTILFLRFLLTDKDDSATGSGYKINCKNHNDKDLSMDILDDKKRIRK